MKNSKEREVEMRLEDLGKQLVATAEPVSMDVVESEIQKYTEKTKSSKVFLLYGKEAGYFQVFIGSKSGHGVVAFADDYARHIREFMEESFYLSEEGTEVSLTDVRFIQDEKDVEGLSIWIGTSYFQLMPFDFGVEYVTPIG